MNGRCDNDPLDVAERALRLPEFQARLDDQRLRTAAVLDVRAVNISSYFV